MIAYEVTVEVEEALVERYLELHAPALHADFATHFPSGTTLSREIREALGRWHPTKSK